MALALWPQLQFTARMVYQPGQAGVSPDWTAISTSATSLYTVAALGALFVGYRRSTDVTERRRVRVLVFGSVVGLTGLLPVVSAYWTRPDASMGYSAFASPVAALGTMAGLALPTSFAYAILRHRLFDVGYIIRRGLQYALARRVLVSAVPALAAIFLADLWFHRQVPLVDVLRARGWVYAGLATMTNRGADTAQRLARRARSAFLPRAVRRGTPATCRHRRDPARCKRGCGCTEGHRRNG
jgi:hypothetical protein